MAIIFEVQAKKSPKDKSVKYYPVVKTVGRINEHEVARQLAEETTLNPKEAEFVLAQLEKIVQRNIKNGCSVKIGEWATFFATVTATGADTSEGVSASNINALRVHCRFGKDFRYELQKAEFINKKKLEHE